ncbi:hypothetical protein [Ralstonia holmesii]|uniref:hypothetical protein n=1 Tax=Ralstonia holmesii TaxID=3058602 RepID=UPI003F16E60B
MGKFLVRVTIHDGSREDYERLHEALARIEFYRCIVGDDLRAHWLLDATYMGFSAFHVLVLRDLVVDVTQRAVPRTTAPQVLVVRYEEAAWVLDEISASRSLVSDNGLFRKDGPHAIRQV